MICIKDVTRLFSKGVKVIFMIVLRKRLFAGLIRQIVAYLPDKIRQIRTYLPDSQGHKKRGGSLERKL